jgi:hypothetical protein
MQCSSCGATLQPGMTTCPSCGAYLSPRQGTVAADMSDSPPYEGYDEPVPYIPYDTPTLKRPADDVTQQDTDPPDMVATEQPAPAPGQAASVPASSSSETQAPEQSLHGPSSQANETFTQEAVSDSNNVILSRSPERSEGEGAAENLPHDQDVMLSEAKNLSQTQDQDQEAEPQPEPVAPAQQVQRSRRGQAASVIALFVILVLLVIGSGGGLTYYVTTFHPAELRVQATAVTRNVLAQATAQANAINPQLLYQQVVKSKPTISDPLNNPNTSIWQASPSCTLTNGTYHSSISTKSEIVFCRAALTDFQDVAFQVQMTTLKGDLGGLMFRSSVDASSNIQSYFFGLDSNGGYHLFTLQGAGLVLLGNGTSSAATTGFNKPNLLTVIARGTRFYLYVNKQFATSINDNSYVSGGVGLFALDLQNPTDIEFNNAQVWTL